MTGFTLVEALMVGLVYYLAYCEVSMPLLGAGLQDPVTSGLIIGFLFGDYKLGMEIGVGIGLMFFNAGAQVGGNLPTDAVLAACIVVPLSIKYNIPVATAMGIAAPFGVLGTFVDNARRMINGVWNRQAQKHVDEGKWNMLTFDSIIGPSIVSAVLRIVPLALLLYLFGDAAGEVVSTLPAWLTNGFGVIAGLLPGLGLVLCVQFIGKQELLPYFLVGFFAVLLGQTSTVFIALIGVCLAFLHIQFIEYKFEDDYDDDEEEEETEIRNPYRPDAIFPSKTAYFWWVMKFNFFYRISQCLEYFYGTGTACTMYAQMKRVYGDNEEGLKVAYKRELKPFITNMAWGTELTTIALVMEEDIAKNGDPDGLKGQAIESFKTGLMGPMAGLGDTIEVAIFMPIFKSICYPLAAAGNIAGAFPFTYWFAWQLVPSYVTGRIGYEQGQKGLTKLLSSSIITKLLYGAGILGILLMGAMCASYCHLDFTISWTNALGVETNINAMLNSLIPGFSTLAYLGFVYLLLNKGVSFTKIMIGVVIFGLVGALIGIV